MISPVFAFIIFALPTDRGRQRASVEIVPSLRTSRIVLLKAAFPRRAFFFTRRVLKQPQVGYLGAPTSAHSFWHRSLFGLLGVSCKVDAAFDWHHPLFLWRVKSFLAYIANFAYGDA